MATRTRKKGPTWHDVKVRLAEFDRSALVGLVQDMYAFSKDNQSFLHARFGIGADALAPYKATIARWLSPDVYKNQQISVALAKRAVADYRKASGGPEGLAELMVFYCECATRFSVEYGMDDQAYLGSLVRMFAQVLELSSTLAAESREAIFDRLDDVRRDAEELGYGVGDIMNELLDRADPSE